jgi:uncharacterized protein HemY
MLLEAQMAVQMQSFQEAEEYLNKIGSGGEAKA